MSNEAHEKGIEAAEKVAIDYGSNPDGTLHIEMAIKAYLSASNQVIVPRDPTEQMLIDCVPHHARNWKNIYRSMISAAPNPFESKQDE